MFWRERTATATASRRVISGKTDRIRASVRRRLKRNTRNAAQPKSRAAAMAAAYGIAFTSAQKVRSAAYSAFTAILPFATCCYFIIAAATFLNALTSFSMNSSVYVGCVQKEIVASASECATGQLTLV